MGPVSLSLQVMDEKESYLGLYTCRKLFKKNILKNRH